MKKVLMQRSHEEGLYKFKGIVSTSSMASRLVHPSFDLVQQLVHKGSIDATSVPKSNFLCFRSNLKSHKLSFLN